MSAIFPEAAGGGSAAPDDPRYNESIVTKAMVPVAVMLGIATIVFCARIYARFHTYKSLWWDDFVIAIAMVLSICMFALLAKNYSITGGRHSWFLAFEQIQAGLRLSFVMMFLWVWAVSLTKVSILLMLLRVKQTVRWVRGITALIVFVFLVGIGITICQLIQCSPPKANWEIMLALTHCWDAEKVLRVNYGMSSLLIATDIVCALLPIVFIRKINRPLREKIVIGALMGLGLVASACGLAKVVMLRSILFSGDPAYDGADLSIWAFAELFVGMIAACIPCLKALLERLFHAIGGQLTSTMSKTSSQNHASRHTAGYGGDYDMRALPASRSHHAKSAHMSDEISDDIPLARHSASGPNGSESHETIPEEGLGIRKAVEFSWSEHRVEPR